MKSFSQMCRLLPTPTTAAARFVVGTAALVAAAVAAAAAARGRRSMMVVAVMVVVASEDASPCVQLAERAGASQPIDWVDGSVAGWACGDARRMG